MRDTLVVLRKFHLFSAIGTLRLQDRKTFQTKKGFGFVGRVQVPAASFGFLKMFSANVFARVVI